MLRAGKKVLEVLLFVAAEGDYVLPSDFIAPGEKLPSSFTSFFDEALASMDGDVYERAKKTAAAPVKGTNPPWKTDMRPTAATSHVPVTPPDAVYPYWASVAMPQLPAWSNADDGQPPAGEGGNNHHTHRHTHTHPPQQLRHSPSHP